MNQCRFSAHWKWTSGLRFANRPAMPSWWMSRRKQPTNSPHKHRLLFAVSKMFFIDCCSHVTMRESKLQRTTGLYVLYASCMFSGSFVKVQRGDLSFIFWDWYVKIAAGLICATWLCHIGNNFRTAWWWEGAVWLFILPFFSFCLVT